MAAEKQTLYCSFCHKSQHKVKCLIAGSKVYICNECVALCMEICMERDFQASFDDRETMIDLTAANYNPGES